MDLSLVLPIVGVVLVAAIGILKLIAPKTQSDADDKALSLLEKLASFVFPPKQ